MDEPTRPDAGRSLRVLIEPSPLPGRLVVSVVARHSHGGTAVDALMVRRSVAGDLKSHHPQTILRECVLALRQASDAINQATAGGGSAPPGGGHGGRARRQERGQKPAPADPGTDHVEAMDAAWVAIRDQ